MERFFATCPRGLEPLLAAELQRLNAETIDTVGGGVQFSGDFSLCYRINLESRIASRVLWQVATNRYRNEDDIYRIAYALPWNDWFEPKIALRVDVSAIQCPLTSLNFVTLKIKDAVCDKIRRLSGRRPDVDTRQPDIPLIITLITLAIFGYIKGHFTGAPPLRSASQTVLIGGLAAAVAFMIARAIS
jgi:putative N6-adenine-specific DNA methylase